MPDTTLFYAFPPYLSIIMFVCVHVLTVYIPTKNPKLQGKFLSMGGGVAIAYVFIDLLPNLCKSDVIIQQAFIGIFPFVERHAYIMALSGFLLFFAVDRLNDTSWRQSSYILSITSYAIFNFLVAYAVTYKNDPEIQPRYLFTFAIALHYFTNDYTINRDHGDAYKLYERWILAASLVAGWITGNLFVISVPAIALINAFIGGGVIMNVIRHELPAENPNSTGVFLLSAALYTAILFVIGT